jgi:WD40 repeat protein
VRLLLEGEQGHSVAAVAFSPDAKALAAGSSDARIHLWDTSTWGVTQTLPGHAGGVTALAFSPDSRHLFSAGADGTARRWDVATGEEACRFGPVRGSLHSLAVAPDGKTVAAGTAPGTPEDGGPRIHLWEAATGRQFRTWKVGNDGQVPLSSLAFSPDGKALASNSQDGIRLWDPATGKPLNPSAEAATDPVCLSYSPDGRVLAIGGGRQVRLWDTRTWREITRLAEVGAEVNSVAFSPGGKELASGEGPPGVVRIWDVATGKPRGQSPRRKTWVRSVSFSPRGDLLAGLSPGEVVLWDASSGRERRRVPIPPKVHPNVQQVRFSPDGRFLASAGQTGALRLWDPTTGEQVRSLGPEYGWGAGFVAFSPDGKTLAAPGGAGVRFLGMRSEGPSVCLWEVASRKDRRRFSGLDHPVGLGAAFSPDGRILAVVDCDGQVRLWDVSRGREVRRLLEHGAWGVSLAFSPDGKALATGGADATVLIWDVNELVPRRGPAGAELTPSQKERLWEDLAGDQAGRAYEAIWALAEHPGEVEAFLQERLRTCTRGVSVRLASLIGALDDDRFPVRQKAVEELEGFSHVAEPALRGALEGKPSLEVRRRAEQLLRKLREKEPGPDSLRILRAVEALEHLGTPSARQVLAELAREEVPTLLSWGAKAALRRLAGRTGAVP